MEEPFARRCENDEDNLLRQCVGANARQIIILVATQRSTKQERDSVLSWRVPITLLMHRIGAAAGE